MKFVVTYVFLSLSTLMLAQAEKNIFFEIAGSGGFASINYEKQFEPIIGKNAGWRNSSPTRTGNARMYTSIEFGITANTKNNNTILYLDDVDVHVE